MKFLIIGLGSMGKRRIRNLHNLNEKDIIGFDYREDRRKETEELYNIKTYENIEKALEEKPDIFIISTPPNHHLTYEMMAAEKGIHFFCEVGVSYECLDKLSKICKKNNVIGIHSATMRFNPSIKKIKEYIDCGKIGKVVAFLFHLGQWLPDWHPWESITDFYVGNKKTSATREMVPFELGWLHWIFGDITKISCMKDKISSLKTDIDDVYQLLVKFKSGMIGNILVDVVVRNPYRFIRIIGEEGTIEWDWQKDELKTFDPEKKKWEIYKEPVGTIEKGYICKEDAYIDEIKCFIGTVRGKNKFPYSFEEDIKILKMLEMAETSNEQGKHINVKF